MSTSACDDQFCSDPVVTPILHRNVSDLEKENNRLAINLAALHSELDQLRELHNAMLRQQPALYIAFTNCGKFIQFWTRSKTQASLFALSNNVTADAFFAQPASAEIGAWIDAAAEKPPAHCDVLLTILTDGTDTEWATGFWGGVYWYILDYEHDEPIEVNAGCNFVVTHWALVKPAAGAQ